MERCAFRRHSSPPLLSFVMFGKCAVGVRYTRDSAVLVMRSCVGIKIGNLFESLVFRRETNALLDVWRFATSGPAYYSRPANISAR